MDKYHETDPPTRLKSAVLGGKRPPKRASTLKPKMPCSEIAVLSPCENFTRMTPNPFYREEMEIYEEQMKEHNRKQS